MYWILAGALWFVSFLAATQFMSFSKIPLATTERSSFLAVKILRAICFIITLTGFGWYFDITHPQFPVFLEDALYQYCFLISIVLTGISLCTLHFIPYPIDLKSRLFAYLAIAGMALPADTFFVGRLMNEHLDRAQSLETQSQLLNVTELHGYGRAPHLYFAELKVPGVPSGNIKVGISKSQADKLSARVGQDATMITMPGAMGFSWLADWKMR